MRTYDNDIFNQSTWMQVLAVYIIHSTIYSEHLHSAFMITHSEAFCAPVSSKFSGRSWALFYLWWYADTSFPNLNSISPFCLLVCWKIIVLYSYLPSIHSQTVLKSTYLDQSVSHVCNFCIAYVMYPEGAKQGI